MPQERSITTNLSGAMIDAMEEIAKENDWIIKVAQRKALESFVRDWKAQKTSRKYYGRSPDATQRTVWVSDEIREDLGHIRGVDGVGLSTIIQEAFRRYCDAMGHSIPGVGPHISERQQDTGTEE